jgi:hypothetical protein
VGPDVEDVVLAGLEGKRERERVGFALPGELIY